MILENNFSACYLGACEMHILKMVYFPIATLFNIYSMNNQSIQVLHDLFNDGISLKTVCNLNYFLKNLPKSLREQLSFVSLFLLKIAQT